MLFLLRVSIECCDGGGGGTGEALAVDDEVVMGSGDGVGAVDVDAADVVLGGADVVELPCECSMLGVEWVDCTCRLEPELEDPVCSTSGAAWLGGWLRFILVERGSWIGIGSGVAGNGGCGSFG